MATDDPQPMVGSAELGGMVSMAVQAVRDSHLFSIAFLIGLSAVGVGSFAGPKAELNLRPAGSKGTALSNSAHLPATHSMSQPSISPSLFSRNPSQFFSVHGHLTDIPLRWRTSVG